MSVIKLSEAAIKARLLTLLRDEGALPKNAVVANEFCLGNLSFRADLAVLSDSFIGIEIKSELDSLRRLADQTRGYLTYFDKVIIVLASKHLQNVDLKDLTGADVLEVNKEGQFLLRAVASPRLRIEKKPFSDLMTQAERKWASKELSAALAAPNWVARRTQERHSFYQAFHQRFQGTSDNFWNAVGRRVISEQDLALLSRYRDARESRAKWYAQQTLAAQEWLEKAERCFA
ncbi:MAG TPA: sce7726 family protein [Rhizomicrobium sp.]|jgi:hypothetical protein